MSLTSEHKVSSSARVQVIPAPIASPGKCVFCGKNQHDKGFIDPKLDFEFYGTLYFCADCVGDIARTLGYIDTEQAIKLAQEIRRLSEELELHREALLNLEESVEHLTNYRMLRSLSADSNSNVSISGSADETPTIIDEAPGGAVIEFPTATNESEPNISESVEQQGSDDISESTSSSDASPIIPL